MAAHNSGLISSGLKDGTDVHIPTFHVDQAPLNAQSPSKRQMTPDGVRELLGIREPDITSNKYPCHGINKDGGLCSRLISKESGTRVEAITTALSRKWTIANMVEGLLEELSLTVMCKGNHNHQRQAQPKFEEWAAIFRAGNQSQSTMSTQLDEALLSALPQTPKKQMKKGVHAAIGSFDADTPNSSISSFWSSANSSPSNSSTATTPFGSPERVKAVVTSPLEKKSACRDLYQEYDVDFSGEESDGRSWLRTDPLTPPTQCGTQTRLTEKVTPGALSLTRVDPVVFEPFKSSKSHRDILNLIQKKFSEKEEEAGIVYAYHRPGIDLIKIGLSANIRDRMIQIERACKYKPQVFFKLETNNVARVERLVHFTLDIYRRREVLHNGRCNGGKGCNKKHGEWFEGVTEKHVEKVMRAWVTWFKLEPYDVLKGILKEEWSDKIKSFKPQGVGNEWLDWTTQTTLKEEVELKPLKRELKVEVEDEIINLKKIPQMRVKVEEIINDGIGEKTPVIKTEVN